MVELADFGREIHCLIFLFYFFFCVGTSTYEVCLLVNYLFVFLSVYKSHLFFFQCKLVQLFALGGFLLFLELSFISVCTSTGETGVFSKSVQLSRSLCEDRILSSRAQLHLLFVLVYWFLLIDYFSIDKN